MIEASSWDLGLDAGIWALRLGFESGRGGTNGEEFSLFVKAQVVNPFRAAVRKTRLDTWLPMSHAGGEGPYLRSLDHLSRSSEVK